MRALACVSMLCASATAGTLIARNPDTGSVLRLLDTPCTHAETLGKIPAPLRSQFLNVRIVDSKGFIQIYGCWREESGYARVILQDGAQRVFELSIFTDPVI